jgi:phage baseplate assembly protein W
VSITVTETTGGEDFPAAPVGLLPLQIADGALVTVPQGSAAELSQSVLLLLTTRPGERLEDPDYGTTDLTFRTEIDPQEVIDVIATQEPRAQVDVVVTPAGSRSHIEVDVRTEEG